MCAVAKCMQRDMMCYKASCAKMYLRSGVASSIVITFTTVPSFLIFSLFSDLCLMSFIIGLDVFLSIDVHSCFCWPLASVDRLYG